MDTNSSRSAHSVKEISQLLLQGWTLLNQTCPLCNTPLVHNRSSKDTYCALCELNVVTEVEAKDMKLQDTAPVEISDVQSDTEEWAKPSPEEQAMMRTRQERSDKASAQLGSLLLQGWAMLDKYCARSDCGVPLMRSTDNEFVCVLCGTCDEDGQPLRRPVEQKAVEQQPQAPVEQRRQPSTTDRQQQRRQAVDVSARSSGEVEKEEKKISRPHQPHDEKSVQRVDSVLASTIAALANKMETMSAELDVLDGSTAEGRESVRGYCQTLQCLAVAAVDLRQYC